MSQRTLLLDIFLQSSFSNRRQAEDERHLSFPVSSFSQVEFTLEPNNVAGTNINSIYSLGIVDKFLYLYTPFDLELTLGSFKIPNFNKLFIISGSLPFVILKNTSFDKSVTFNAIHT